MLDFIISEENPMTLTHDDDHRLLCYLSGVVSLLCLLMVVSASPEPAQAQTLAQARDAQPSGIFTPG